MSFARFLQNTKDTTAELAKLRKLADKPKALSKANRTKVGRYPALFRQVCQSLALARHRDYSTVVVTQLNRIALESHHRMYGSPGRPWAGFVKFFTTDFPVAVRSEKWIAFWCFAMLFAPVFIIAFVVQSYPELPFSILGTDMIRKMESMYTGDVGVVTVERPIDDDLFMLGFYIRNNVGIAFFTFAGGVAAGLGTMFFLLYNGIVFGAVGGHLHRIGAGENLYQFVIAHGSLELTGFAVAGMAGFVLARALVSPGQYTRKAAFLRSGRKALTIAIGAGTMVFFAAFIEAFWSPRVLPVGLKYVVGTGCWIAVALYFVFAGRSFGASRVPAES